MHLTNCCRPKAGIAMMVILLWPFLLQAQENTAYLFTYFTGNGAHHEAIRFAISYDGYHYKALNNNEPILSPDSISSTGGVRDPHILRGADGHTFYMVATDMQVAKFGWGPNLAMVLMKSEDLIHWTSTIVNIPNTFPEFKEVNRVWAPQTIYDEKEGRYMLYWSMRFGQGPDKIYYAYANNDFTGIATTPKQLFFNPDNGACIDGDIIPKDGRFYLFYKTESGKAGIKVAVSDQLTEGYVPREGYVQQTNEAVEGAGVFKLNNGEGYILMYDVYKKGKYQFTKTKDLQTFTVIDDEVSMDFHPRHGTVMPVTPAEVQRLVQRWMPVTQQGYHNPVLKGLYADPDILYAKKTNRYYIYPTSDGYNNWSATSFKVFSSDDLVNWKDEGVILDLAKDVTWAHTNAWAPCIIEKKIKGKYQYFYYFTAGKKIGVAVASSPTGPFKDLGKPLIDAFPPGVTRGQQIDPAVFTDPATGKSYLYWGNSYLAGAALSEDMTSLVPGTLRLLTPDATYGEGSYVFYRKGKYYFTWSQNDTRSPDYRVRYGIADSPLGKISIPAENLVIAKDTAAGILGTGHHAVLQLPGKDEWYIAYHRFNYPAGRYMGRTAGYNREVCIDSLRFDASGNIIRVIPTHAGIAPVPVKK